jgi:hypothetical protein
MTAQLTERKRKRLAPYVPASALSEFFDHIRTVREPETVDSGLLQDYGLSPTNALALLSTLKFLGVTDDRGRPTPVFRQLQTGGDEFKEALKGVVERAYSDLLSRLDVSRDTKDKIVNYFARNYSPATAERAARLFLDICGEAGIPTASQPRKSDTAKSKARLKSRQLQIQEQNPRDGDEKIPEVLGKAIPDVQSRSIQLPLSPTSWATLSASFPLTDEAWEQMLTLLNAMKPALVVDKPKTPQQSPSPKQQEPINEELLRKVETGVPL